MFVETTKTPPPAAGATREPLRRAPPHVPEGQAVAETAPRTLLEYRAMRRSLISLCTHDYGVATMEAAAGG